MGPPLPDAAATLGLVPLATPHGTAWSRDRAFPLPSFHGGRAIRDAFEAPPDHLAELFADPRLLGFDASRALFLDIEASGLEHGAGTFAFCVGLARREGDWLVLRQLVLLDPAEEQALLHELGRLLNEARFLVSFNGKSYDLTVLQSRLVIHRFFSARDCDLKLRPHLDLLHAARSLYRGSMEDTRLATLERSLLGVTRVDDVPGHLVPSCWYHYLRTSETAPLAAVLAHNAVDVVSMVTLAAQVLQDSAPGHESGLPGVIRANLGALWMRRRRPRDAIRALALLVNDPPPPPATERGLELCAKAARLVGDRGLEASALDRWVAELPTSVAARRARSLYRERRGGDLAGALDDARSGQALDPTPRVARRVATLERRLDARARVQLE
jgi:uncharacterized protein YprB with RNaseH-like and TPR domain